MPQTTTLKNKGAGLRHLAMTVVINTLIACLLIYLFQDNSFWTYFIISQCIGLSICTLSRYSLMLFQPQSPVTRVAVVTGAILVGGLLGGFAGGWLTGVDLAGFSAQKVYTIRIVILSLLFGGIIAFYFYSREQIAETRQQLQEERIQRLTSEKQAVQAQLRMLQAQIEPHFLFNTLANIHSLLDSDSEKGKRMLADLTRYLRATLAETRAQWTTLGNEIDLITAYLNIFQIRMDDRLHVKIEMEEQFRPIPFSPMLIQPLVENALIHGLDKTIEGGSIRIRVEKEDGIIRISVIDTGKGFAADQSYGLGLTNIRDRLESLYDGQARLLLTENRPTGIKAIIEVPYANTN
jgi:sensor histidine kinase YesM